MTTETNEPKKYSREWIAKELAGRDWMPLRRCSFCQQSIGYIHEHGQLAYASSCGCTRYYTAPDPRDWQDIADTLAMQSSDEVRDHIMETLKGEREPQ